MKYDREVAVMGAFLPEGTYPNFWGTLETPPLQEATMADWQLKQRQFDPPLRIRGYFSPGYHQLKHNWMLIKGHSEQAVTWMSITPMELESQVHHAAAATGNVLVGGLGLGILAWNVAKKRNVQHVLVVERDASIIELITQMAQQFAWSDWGKVEIVHADLFEFKTKERFDVALLDVWPDVGATELRADLVRFANEVVATEYAAWGQELDFVSWLSENKVPPSHVQSKHWPEYSRSIGVPLIMQHEPRMAKLALQAAINGVKHEADKAFGPDRRL